MNRARGESRRGKKKTHRLALSSVLTQGANNQNIVKQVLLVTVQHGAKVWHIDLLEAEVSKVFLYTKGSGKEAKQNKKKNKNVMRLT